MRHCHTATFRSILSRGVRSEWGLSDRLSALECPVYDGKMFSGKRQWWVARQDRLVNRILYPRRLIEIHGSGTARHASGSRQNQWKSGGSYLCDRRVSINTACIADKSGFCPVFFLGTMSLSWYHKQGREMDKQYLIAEHERKPVQICPYPCADLRCVRRH